MGSDECNRRRPRHKCTGEGSETKGGHCSRRDVASRGDAGAPAAGGGGMAGVRTEAVTRAKDGRTAGGQGMGGEEWIHSESVQGDEGWRGLQKDTGVWRGEGSACRNSVEEDEGVRGGVGAQRGGEGKYSKRGGRRKLVRGGTGQGERGKRKKTQCGVGRGSAVDVWSGECGEYRGERSGTATQGSMGMEEAGGGIGGGERKYRRRGAN